ncbi:MAG: 3-deoxy-manno-octulosonate cytidylyltransferase [Candidatus Omnitrophica bacterium]|nr:3-deoxy-manno-octulosonate cytidylyltransferase [Candidatus Omnitrophota bacterium]
MKIIGVIPARWASTRFEGKVLATINDKPMIQHVWERSNRSELLNDLIIACDDERVVVAAEQFGAKTVLTSKDHASGTDRIAEAIESMDGDIIVNVQGDEPLIDPAVIDALVTALVDDPSCAMGTVIKVLTAKKELKDPNVVKVVIDGEGNALYFSRSPIPYNRDDEDEVIYYKHLGIYAYRRDFLLSYKSLPKSNLEKCEQLEQLRALEFGYKIKTVVTDIETIGVDTPEDLTHVEKVLSKSVRTEP